MWLGKQCARLLWSIWEFPQRWCLESCQINRNISFLATKSITKMDHPPRSSDLVPFDFWLFPKLKKCTEGAKICWHSWHPVQCDVTVRYSRKRFLRLFSAVAPSFHELNSSTRRQRGQQPLVHKQANFSFTGPFQELNCSTTYHQNVMAHSLLPTVYSYFAPGTFNVSTTQPVIKICFSPLQPSSMGYQCPISKVINVHCKRVASAIWIMLEKNRSSKQISCSQIFFSSSLKLEKKNHSHKCVNTYFNSCCVTYKTSIRKLAK
jgi:hypothetical protein